MAKKLYHKELEQRVLELEKEAEKRKQTEETLKETEERFKTVVEQSSAAIEIYEPKGRLLIVNDAWTKFWGLKKDAVADFNILDDPECEKTGLTSAFKKAQQGKSRILPDVLYDAEESGLTGGHKRWISARMYPIKDQKGKLKNIILTYDDITERKQVEEALRKAHDDLEQRVQERTEELERVNEQLTLEMEERKQAEEALRASEAKYRKLLEQSPDPIGIVQENRHVFINAAYANLFGYTMQDVNNGLDLFQLIPETKHDFVIERAKEWLERKGPKEKYTILDLVAKGGERIPCEISGNIIDFDGRPATQVTIRDITDRKRAEEGLRQSEERFRSLVEITSDWIWEVDQNGVFNYADPKVKDFLGYKPEEVVGKPYNYFMTEDSKKRLASSFKDQAENPRPVSRRDNIQLHKDGRQIMIETSGLPIFDIDGKLVGWRGLDTDITERKQAEAERERLIGELQKALDNIKTLRGMVPICASCKKIRDDKGYWNQIEGYIERHSEALFSHALCPDCMDKFYGDEDWYKKLDSDE